MKHVILALVAFVALAHAKDVAPLPYPAAVHCVAEGRKLGDIVTKEQIRLVGAILWAKCEDGLLLRVENVHAPAGKLATITGECMVFAYHDSLPESVRKAAGGFDPRKARLARKAREAAMASGNKEPFPKATVGSFKLAHLDKVVADGRNPFRR